MRGATWVVVVLLAGVASSAGQRPAHIGYAFPAGGKQGTEVEVEIGGQYLTGADLVVVSGEGVEVEVVDHHRMPSNENLGEIRGKVKAAQRELPRDGGVSDAKVRAALRKAGVSEKELWQVAVYDRQRKESKRQPNAQIAELVRVRMKIADDAEPGLRFVRVRAEGGLSNPVRFVVGELEEVVEGQPYDDLQLGRLAAGHPPERLFAERARKGLKVSPPVTVNGRILPGEVDVIEIPAKRGEQMVVRVEARRLVPYLADAVPGWFQAYVALFDPTGKEVATGGAFRHDPDPVLFYKVPLGGTYRLEIRDSVTRGREDFVYRVSVGELPYLTGVSPKGGRAGERLEVVYHGANLEAGARVRPYAVPTEPGIVELRAPGALGSSNPVGFQIDALPEVDEPEPAEDSMRTMWLDGESVVNARIGAAGDVDLYRVRGARMKTAVFEVFARRLNSPLDAKLTILDSMGDVIAANDDHEDPASGLVTHHADPRVAVELPPGGDFVVAVSDAQNRGGPEYGYRLRFAAETPRFLLRATPPSVNARAGGSGRVTVHALRLDGYDGAIRVAVEGRRPGGEVIRGSGVIAAGKDTGVVSVPVSEGMVGELVPLTVSGVAGGENGGGGGVRVEAKAADDMMQAFIYRHLVPVDGVVLAVGPPKAAE